MEVGAWNEGDQGERVKVPWRGRGGSRAAECCAQIVNEGAPREAGKEQSERWQSKHRGQTPGTDTCHSRRQCGVPTAQGRKAPPHLSAHSCPVALLPSPGSRAHCGPWLQCSETLGCGPEGVNGKLEWGAGDVEFPGEMWSRGWFSCKNGEPAGARTHLFRSPLNS